MKELRLIEASAGCGKTTYLLNQYLKKPINSLFITFSNAASNELKMRLNKNSSFTRITTLHSLAYTILSKKYPNKNITENSLYNEALSLLLKNEDFKNLYLWLKNNSDGVIEEVVEEEFKIFKEKPILNIDKFNILFNDELINQEILNQIKLIFYTKEKKIRKNIKLDIFENIEIVEKYKKQIIKRIEMHEKYIKKYSFLVKNKLFFAIKMKEKELKKINNLIYYEDLIIDTIKLIKENDVALFQTIGDITTIYIDEAQDLSQTQWELIITILKSMNNNIEKTFVAGDSKQLIYEFQGSNINIFNNYKNELKTMFHTYEEIFLNKTYRISKSICNVLNKIGPKLDIDFQTHETNNINSGRIDIINYKDLNDILKYINQESMILFKQKSEKFEKLALILIQNGFFINSPYIMIHPIFKDFQYLLRWLIYQDPFSLGVIGNIFGHFQVPYQTLLTIKEIQSLSNLKYKNLIKLFFNWISIDNVKNFYYEKLKESADFYLNLLFEYVKYYKHEPYHAIFDTFDFYKNNMFLFKNGIFFNTIHSSKGKESDTVILFDTDINTKFNIESNRLLYVAITRARNNLIIPVSNKINLNTWLQVIKANI